MAKQSCCHKKKLRRGLWSPEEDEKLMNHIAKYGHGCWSSVPKLAGITSCLYLHIARPATLLIEHSSVALLYSSRLKILVIGALCFGCWALCSPGLERCGKSCRLRWINYLRPDLKRGTFSQEEEDLIIHLHSLLGNK